MRLPRVRFTVRRMMVAVFIMAMNIGLIRGANGLTGEGSVWYVLFAYAFIPSFSLLAVALVDAVKGLVRYGKASSFSTGYLLLGGLASLSVSLAFTPMAFTQFTSISYPVPETSQQPFSMQEILNLLLVIGAFTLPQVVPALVGGKLAAWQGLTLSLRRDI